MKTVLELYNLEIHQKKSKPDHHRLKTMVKRSIEQDPRTRNFEARIGRIESNMLVKDPREQRPFLKAHFDCWRRKTTGQCSERKQLQFPAGHEEAWQTCDSARSFSRTSQLARCERFRKSVKSWRPKPVWEIHSHAMQTPSEKYLRESLL